MLITLDDPLSSRDIQVGLVQLRPDSGLTPAQFLRQASFVFRNGAAPVVADEDGGALNGTAGFNHLVGSALKDIIRGLGGNDILEGAAGRDTLQGGDGGDRLSGGDAGDQLRGDAGDDVMDGGAGDDNLEGGAGNDRLISGGGDDVLRGGDGDDVLIATGDRVILTGGAGEDTFVLNIDALSDGRTRLVDFDPEEDRLLLDPDAELTAATLVINEDRIQLQRLVEGAGSGITLEFEAWDTILNGF